MKRLILHVRSQDGERVDRVEYLPGDVLTLIQRADRGIGPKPGLVALSDVVGGSFEDPEAAEAARAERRRLTAVYLDNDDERKP